MNNQSNAPEKRILLVNRDFQFRYTRMSVAIGIVSTFLTSLVILYPLFLFKILVIPQFLPLPILLGMIAAGLVNIGFLVVFGIVISHRIAGPLFNLVRHFRRLSNGQWKTTMHVRQGDDLGFVARHVNELSQSLVALAKSDLQALTEIKNQISTNPRAAESMIDALETSITSRIEDRTIPKRST